MRTCALGGRWPVWSSSSVFLVITFSLDLPVRPTLSQQHNFTSCAQLYPPAQFSPFIAKLFTLHHPVHTLQDGAPQGYRPEPAVLDEPCFQFLLVHEAANSSVKRHLKQKQFDNMAHVLRRGVRPTPVRVRAHLGSSLTTTIGVSFLPVVTTTIKAYSLSVVGGRRPVALRGGTAGITNHVSRTPLSARST